MRPSFEEIADRLLKVNEETTLLPASPVAAPVHQQPPQLLADKTNHPCELCAKTLQKKQTLLMSSFSHELRTPLASIVANLDLLAESRSPPAAASRITTNYLDRAQKSACLLGVLIEDVLDVSRANNNSLRSNLNLREFDIVPVLREVCWRATPSPSSSKPQECVRF